MPTALRLLGSRPTFFSRNCSAVLHLLPGIHHRFEQFVPISPSFELNIFLPSPPPLTLPPPSSLLFLRLFFVNFINLRLHFLSLQPSTRPTSSTSVLAISSIVVSLPSSLLPQPLLHQLPQVHPRRKSLKSSQTTRGRSPRGRTRMRTRRTRRSRRPQHRS